MIRANISIAIEKLKCPIVAFHFYNNCRNMLEGSLRHNWISWFPVLSFAIKTGLVCDYFHFNLYSDENKGQNAATLYFLFSLLSLTQSWMSSVRKASAIAASSRTQGYSRPFSSSAPFEWLLCRSIWGVVGVSVYGRLERIVLGWGCSFERENATVRAAIA